jgi:hypothetical protein
MARESLKVKARNCLETAMSKLQFSIDASRPDHLLNALAIYIQLRRRAATFCLADNTSN